MKVLFFKKRTIILSLSILVLMAAISLESSGFNLASIYLNNYSAATKKLPIYAVDTEENKVAISFDAAWGADKTREIMSLCKQHNANATFFLVGFWVENNPELVLEIYNNGFEIGLHSATHPDMRELTADEMREELTTNISLIKDITGTAPTLFRPPYGYYNNTLIEVCEELGLKCIQWSVDSWDWMGISASQLAGRVTSQSENGSIILCHNDSDNIIDGLKMILEFFDQKETSVVAVGDLIYYDNYTINTLGIQIKN